MRRTLLLGGIASCVLTIPLASCDEKVKADPRIEEPPQQDVVHRRGLGWINVDHPEQFPTIAAARYAVNSELNVTGVVNPDVSRNVPVIALASGRVVEINARLGDEVLKGQRLFRLRSTDIAQAFSDYRKAVENEQLTAVQLDRAQILYEKGAIAAKDLEVARNGENNAKVDVDTASERLRVLGSDIGHPTGIVDVYAPISGVITDQQITSSAGVQALSSPNPFTISDLSSVWIICDVYENNLALVHLNESAEIHLLSYPDRVLKAKITNIGAVLDPATRTAKVRLEVPNPGILRIGMFVTARFHGPIELHGLVPASAVLHLHDRTWVYVPVDNHAFRRVEVTAGRMIAQAQQEIVSGIHPGDLVVVNALHLEYTVDR
jgi:cobalt-zinc-cadmium efflux system membrane fusion protein